MKININHKLVLDFFSTAMYVAGSPVLFVKDTASKLRIGNEFPQKHKLSVLYPIMGDYITTFLRLITEKQNYPALEIALGRKPVASDVRCAFRPLEAGLSGFFVDDADPKFQQDFGHVWVETSPESWQVHFLTNRIITSAEALSLQRYFCKQLTGDSSAVAGTQARRFPVEGLEVILYNDRPCYDATELLMMIRAMTPATPTLDLRSGRSQRQQRHDSNWDIERAEKYWNIYFTDIAKANGDPSRADMCLVNRLVSERVFHNEIHVLLRHVSKDIETRKAGHLHDYIERTILKAITKIDQ